MLDGIIGLIVLIAMIIGIAKGIGDGVLKLIGLAGGIGLGIMYSGRVSEFIAGTGIRTTLYNHIFELLSPGAEEYAGEAANGSGEAVSEMLGQGTDPYAGSLPRILGGLITDLADQTTDVAADRLTTIATSILGFILIMIGVWLVMFIIRLLFKTLKKESYIIGFADRLLGMVLGLVRGLILACIFMAALIPVATLIAPDRVPDILTAMQDTRVANTIYDINPVMLVIKYILGH